MGAEGEVEIRAGAGTGAGASVVTAPKCTALNKHVYLTKEQTLANNNRSNLCMQSLCETSNYSFGHCPKIYYFSLLLNCTYISHYYIKLLYYTTLFP